MINEWICAGPQAGNGNSFFEISQKNSSVCWQLCIPAELKSLVEVPFKDDSSPHLFRPPVSTWKGNTIRLKNNRCKKTKGVFCIWCLFAKQNNGLLYYFKYSSGVKNVTRRSGLGKNMAGSERQKQKEHCNCTFIPTWHPECYWEIADQIDHKAFQKHLFSQKKNLKLPTLSPLLLPRPKEDWPEISIPRNSFLSAEVKTQLRCSGESEKPSLSSLKFLTRIGGYTVWVSLPFRCC